MIIMRLIMRKLMLAYQETSSLSRHTPKAAPQVTGVKIIQRTKRGIATRANFDHRTKTSFLTKSRIIEIRKNDTDPNARG